MPDLGGYETDSDVHYSIYDRGDGTCLTRVTFPASKESGIVDASATTEVTDSDVDSDDTVPFSTGGPVGLESLDQPDIEVDQALDTLTVDDVLDTEEKDRAYIIHNWTRGRDENDDPLLNREDRQRILGNHNASDLADLMYKSDASQRAKIVSDYGLDSLPSHLDTSTVARSVIQNQTRGRQVLQDQEVTAMNKVAKALGRNKSNELTKNTREDMEGEMGQGSKNLLDGRNDEHKKMLDYIKDRNGQGPPWDGDKNPPAKGNPLG